MERPGGGICADAPILDGGNFGCRPRVNHALRVTIKEGQVQCLLGHNSPRITGGIRDQTIWIMGEIFYPGASPGHLDGGGATMCTEYPKLSEQAEAAQHTCCNDHNDQSH